MDPQPRGRPLRCHQQAGSGSNRGAAPYPGWGAPRSWNGGTAAGRKEETPALLPGSFGALRRVIKPARWHGSGRRGRRQPLPAGMKDTSTEWFDAGMVTVFVLAVLESLSVPDQVATTFPASG